MANKGTIKKTSKAPASKAPAKSKAKAKSKAPAKEKVLRVGGRKLKPGKKTHADFKRVSLRISAKTPVVKKPAPAVVTSEEDSAKSMAFAMSIAEEMKRAAAKVDSERTSGDESIRLTRRPTTRAQGKATEKFSQADLKDFRKRLMSAMETAKNGANAMRATGFNESEDHEADGGDGTNQTLRLQALGQMGVINRTLQQIEEALHRIDDGTYGVCTVCGQLIRKPRLLNQPFVLTCMECQNEIERNNRR